MDFTRFRLFVFSTNRDQSPLIRLGLDMCSPGKRQNLVSKSLSKYIPRFLQTEGQFFLIRLTMSKIWVSVIPTLMKTALEALYTGLTSLLINKKMNHQMRMRLMETYHSLPWGSWEVLTPPDLNTPWPDNRIGRLQRSWYYHRHHHWDGNDDENALQV